MHIGRHGEYHVCALLEAVGVEAIPLGGDHNFDIIGLLPSGKMAKIEVKTASQTQERGSFSFYMGKGEPEWLALYAMPTGCVLFMPVAEVGKRKFIRVTVDKFTPDAQANSLAALLDFGQLG